VLRTPLSLALRVKTMNQTLLQLITLFLSRINEAENIMKSHFNVDEPMHFRSNGIERVGNIGDYSYAFHGIGCRFKFGKLVVDYDYSEDGQTNGFDLWRLSQFGRQYKEFREYISSGKIDIDFESSANLQEILKFDQGSLYHLKNT
jgi:hypothetical protein